MNISHNGLRELNAVRAGGTNGTDGMVHTPKTFTTTRVHTVVKVKTITFFFKNKDSRQYFSYIVKYLPSCIKKSCPLLLLDIVYVYCFGNEIKLI